MQPTSDTLLLALQQMIREFGETYIIVDALDECKDREELLEGIRTIASWELKSFTYFVTSQREKGIKEC
jgi:hypothetical protein